MGDREGWVVFEYDFQVIRSRYDLFDRRGNEFESIHQLHATQLDIPLRPEDMDNTP